MVCFVTVETANLTLCGDSNFYAVFFSCNQKNWDIPSALNLQFFFTSKQVQITIFYNLMEDLRSNTGA